MRQAGDGVGRRLMSSAVLSGCVAAFWVVGRSADGKPEIFAILSY